MPRGQGEGKDFGVYLKYTDRDKKELEYDVKAWSDSIDAWVEAEVGREYQIVVKDMGRKKRPAKQAIYVTVNVDGRYVNEGTLALSSRTFSVKTLPLRRDGEVAEYPLSFSETTAVDERDDAELDSEEAAEVGTINIYLEKGFITAPKKEDGYCKTWEVEEVGKVYEKDCKMGHMTTGTKAVASARKTWVSYGSADGEDPFYEFEIKYASRATINMMLNAKKAASRSPSPTSDMSSLPSTSPSQERQESPEIPGASARKRQRSRSSASSLQDEGADPVDQTDPVDHADSPEREAGPASPSPNEAAGIEEQVGSK